jgi:RES domain-containing protein
MDRHPESEALKRGISRCAKSVGSWSGVVYRSASVAYANRDDLLTGLGAKIAGARWNPPNGMATVYSRLSIQTATEEALAHHRYFGFPIETALPKVIVSIRVSFQRILDLTDGRKRKLLGVSRERLLDEDWRRKNAGGMEGLTQAIGRLAWEGGWEGLLAPSSADRKGKNLVIFQENLVPPESYLLIINREQLPRREPPAE